MSNQGSETERLLASAKEKPKIICICGSTRFADLHAVTRWEFEKEGKAICLMINYLPQWYCDLKMGGATDHIGEAAGNKGYSTSCTFVR